MDLGNKYHPNTYAVYGNDHQDAQRTWVSIRWECGAAADMTRVNRHSSAHGTEGTISGNHPWFTVSAKAYSDEEINDFRREFIAIERSLKPLALNSIPSGPGFCMTRGYVNCVGGFRYRPVQLVNSQVPKVQNIEKFQSLEKRSPAGFDRFSKHLRWIRLFSTKT